MRNCKHGKPVQNLELRISVYDTAALGLEFEFDETVHRFIYKIIMIMLSEAVNDHCKNFMIQYLCRPKFRKGTVEIVES